MEQEIADLRVYIRDRVNEHQEENPSLNENDIVVITEMLLDDTVFMSGITSAIKNTVDGYIEEKNSKALDEIWVLQSRENTELLRPGTFDDYDLAYKAMTEGYKNTLKDNIDNDFDTLDHNLTDVEAFVEYRDTMICWEIHRTKINN